MQEDQGLQMLHKSAKSITEFWKCYINNVIDALNDVIDQIEDAVIVDQSTSKRINLIITN